jgi:hypothetical protein
MTAAELTDDDWRTLLTLISRHASSGRFQQWDMSSLVFPCTSNRHVHGPMLKRLYPADASWTRPESSTQMVIRLRRKSAVMKSSPGVMTRSSTPSLVASARASSSPRPMNSAV